MNFDGEAYFQKKGVSLNYKVYLIDALGAMAAGLFCSLLIGLILDVLGKNLGIPSLSEYGQFAMSMTGPAIAVSIALSLKAPQLVMFSAVVVGAIGMKMGGAVGAYLATIIAVEFGKCVSKETKVDIIVTPMFTIIVGATAASLAGPVINELMLYLGKVIMQATEMHPILMGIIVSALMGMILTLPISSAALCVMLNLGGLAGGAATVGCSAHMIGFAVASFRENGIGGLFSQGIGTSMLQMPNIVKKPIILFPVVISSIILGPLATTIFQMTNIPTGSGMGTSGLVGQFGTIAAMGSSSDVWLKIALLHFILPGLIAFIVSELMRKHKLLNFGDQKLDI